ncbi:hypothetical protein FDP41_013276 [Naegleria fowleri]|uniref:Uncharacterized protein n=1 Tax=Naegleria fowleri TaxID=5763 RepID=A0A6A5BRU3_NAEFO|nr:uncharacterized protein FDP41_013276 [Naegleria fowleri]KAF0980793.1 hypothetical protein FDP41_013276 [Naegleria fowleri]CAG4714022.1 unnamed protein product [Naegleria fowleri]
MNENSTNMIVSSTNSVVGDEKPAPTVIEIEQPQTLSKNPFKRRKQRKEQALKAKEEEIPDPREPKLRRWDHWTIYRMFGVSNWFLIFLGCIGAAGAGVIPLCFQFVLGDLINSIATYYNQPDKLRGDINWMAAQFALIALGATIANFMMQFFLNWASERIGANLKEGYFNALTEQEMAFFDIKKVGTLTIALSEDIAKIQDAYTLKFATFVQQFTQFVVGIILAFVSSWQMSLVMISTSPLMVISVGVLSQLIKLFTKKTNEANEHSAAIATEVISCMRTVRSMAGEEKEQQRFKTDLKMVNFYGLLKAIAQGSTFASVSFILWGTVALAFWYGGGLTVDKVISVGDMFKVFGLMLMGVLGLSQAFTFFPELTKARMSQETLLKVIKRQPEIPFKGGKTLDKIEGNISIRNVDFVYPSRPNIVVLKNFSLDIKPGQAVALVGPSGSGKSTIVGLLERFYTPKSGQIFIDGVDIADLDPMWLHRNVGIVTQEPVLFATTIKENIAYAVGMEKVTMQQIEEAAKAANCHNFIMDLPEGYNTMLGEKGVSLSGGQKQRIAIARALLQNPSVLLLDEATSALDTESEALVQAALDHLMKGRTTICIAHRLATVKNSDVICVLAKGVLVEKGKHEELLQIENGVYRKLAEKQMAFGAVGGMDKTASKMDLEVVMDLIEE